MSESCWELPLPSSCQISSSLSHFAIAIKYVQLILSLFFCYSCTASDDENEAKLSHWQLTEEIVFPSISVKVICVFWEQSGLPRNLHYRSFQTWAHWSVSSISQALKLHKEMALPWEENFVLMWTAKKKHATLEVLIRFKNSIADKCLNASEKTSLNWERNGPFQSAVYPILRKTSRTVQGSHSYKRLFHLVDKVQLSIFHFWYFIL